MFVPSRTQGPWVDDGVPVLFGEPLYEEEVSLPACRKYNRIFKLSSGTLKIMHKIVDLLKHLRI